MLDPIVKVLLSLKHIKKGDEIGLLIIDRIPSVSYV